MDDRRLAHYQGMVVSAIQEQAATVTTVRDRYGRQTTSGKLSWLEPRTGLS